MLDGSDGGEESAGLRAEMEAAKSDVRDAEMRGMVQRNVGAMAQQGALLAALANATLATARK